MGKGALSQNIILEDGGEGGEWDSSFERGEEGVMSEMNQGGVTAAGPSWSLWGGVTILGNFRLPGGAYGMKKNDPALSDGRAGTSSL